MGRACSPSSRRDEDDQVLISVSDTGVGLPPQQSDKVFNAFFTTKTQGTGMGLRISRSIVATLLIERALSVCDGCMRKSVRLLHYGVVKVFVGLVTPSLMPLGPIESTV
jgi:phosphoglycerate-specific signal transduction histidine kinase